MKNLLLISLAFVLQFVSCTNPGEIRSLSAKVTKHKYFPGLSSASGVVFSDGFIYLVGDDLPFLFKLDENWNVAGKRKIAGIDSIVNGRTPKSLKADFESMALLEESGSKQLLIFSSGSKRTTRDTAFLLPLSPGGPVFSKNMRPFYEAIIKMANLPAANTINIEGLAVSDDRIFLLHRGNVSENFMIETKRNALLAFIRNDTSALPELKVYPFKLPSSDSVAAGFSGACVLPAYGGLLFTASLESTANETDDGAVLGSYLGFVPFSKLASGEYLSVMVLKEDGSPLQKKLEGVSVKEENDGKINIFAVCDNDDGSSDIFEIALKINQE